MRRLARLGLIALLVAGLAACKSGVGASGGGDLTAGVGIALGDYLVVDLASGAVEPRQDVPDLLTNPAYLDGRMVFRRLPAGSGQLGSGPGQAWGQGDEPAASSSGPEVFLAVFETTRAQWSRLGGGDPSASVGPASLAGGANPARPVCGVSLAAIRSLLAGGGVCAGHLGLPSATAWERAARAGTSTTFAWGEARDEATVGRYAVVRQTASGEGPALPGGREANAWGYFDMAGNLWEWTNEGQLRGGSWSDGLPMARPANRISLDVDTPHALAGVRLTYAP